MIPMKCCDCPYYKSGYLYNACVVTQTECFITQDNCALVKDDGALNTDDEYIKTEYGENVDPYELLKIGKIDISL